MDRKFVPCRVTVPGPAPAAAEAGDRLVRVGTGAAMVIVRMAFPVPPLLVALRVTVDAVAAVGVPEINPVALFTVNPAGNPVAP